MGTPGLETPQALPLPPPAVSISLFFVNNKHTQPQETATPPRDPKVASGWQGGARQRGENLVRCKVCASHSSRLGRRPSSPHRRRPAKAGRHGVGTGGAGLSGREQERNSKPWFTSSYSIHGGHREGVRGGHHIPPPRPRAQGGWCYGWEGGTAATPGAGGGGRQAGRWLDWCPVDALPRAPSTQPDLIGLFVIY